MPDYMIKANMAGIVRSEVLDGKPHLVCPVIMMTEGVHCGSAGPIFYSSEELAKFPEMWDAKPVVINHPKISGIPVSGATPEVTNTTRVGQLFNTKFEDGKLKSEAWIDPTKLASISPHAYYMLDSGGMLEVSIGVFFESETKKGVWNTEEYAQIANNLRPDHLAILPTSTGACSIADGAGMPRLNEETELKMKRILNEVSNFELPDLLFKKVGKNNGWIEDVFEDYFIYGIVEDEEVRYFKRSYKKVEPDDAVIGEESTPVRRIVSYEPKDKEVVTMADETKTEEKVVETKPMTFESYLANTPDEFKAIINEALEFQKSAKNALVEQIVANTSLFTKEELLTKTMNDLVKINELAGKNKLASMKEEVIDNGSTMSANFAGQVVGAINTTSNTVTVTALPDPWKGDK